MTPARKLRVGIALWIVFAFVVWNVIFDRIIVLAGRRYVHDAAVVAHTTDRYLAIDEVMRPAVTHGVWLASSAALAIAGVGIFALLAAAARERGRASSTD
jgi:hypothetical protein